jgi:hypothetical protein
MMYRYRKIFFLIWCVGVFLPTEALHAQGVSGGLTISPAFQEVLLDEKATTKDFTVSVSNHSQTSVVLRVSVYDFGSLDESGGVAFLGGTNDLEKKYALASWVRPAKDVLTIAPDTTETLSVTIENRDSLTPGGHYGAIAFKTEDAAVQESDGDMVSVNQLFSTLVFVKKVGGEIYQLELKESSYTGNLVRLEDVLRLRFENSGNVHVVPRGRVEVTDPLGRLIAKGVINQESAIILPESLRAYSVRLASMARSFIPGRYTMTIAYRYDGLDAFTMSSLQFDFIPPPAMLAFLAFIAGGWYVTKRRRQSGEKRALSRSFESKQGDV